MNESICDNCVDKNGIYNPVTLKTILYRGYVRSVPNRVITTDLCVRQARVRDDEWSDNTCSKKKNIRRSNNRRAYDGRCSTPRYERSRTDCQGRGVWTIIIITNVTRYEFQVQRLHFDGENT